jgi:hypothetical protein
VGEAKSPGLGSESQSSTSVLEQGEITSGHNDTVKGEDPNHKRERRAASEPTRTKRAKTHEGDPPQEERAKIFPIFKESLSREAHTAPQPETRGKKRRRRS